MQTTFDDYWRAIQGLKRAAAMKSWGVAGRAKSTFHLVKADGSMVLEKPENGELRTNLRADFERVFDAWPVYRARGNVTN